MKVTKALVKQIKASGREMHDEDLVNLCTAHLQLLDDNKFLLNRCGSAGSISFGCGRDTGASSNSIVACVYSSQKLSDQVLPSDQGDLDACVRMWDKLPKHRKTKKAQTAMQRARDFIKEKYKSVKSA